MINRFSNFQQGQETFLFSTELHIGFRAHWTSYPKRYWGSSAAGKM